MVKIIIWASKVNYISWQRDFPVSHLVCSSNGRDKMTSGCGAKKRSVEVRVPKDGPLSRSEVRSWVQR